MLIHTVVENIYKHAVSVDNLITILVQVNKTEYKGQEMLCISIEDDGEGYPEEILKLFQAGEKPKTVRGWDTSWIVEPLGNASNHV